MRTEFLDAKFKERNKRVIRESRKKCFFFVYFSEKMKNGQRNWVGGSGGGQKEERERRKG